VRAISANRVTFTFGENRDCDVSGCHEGDAWREGIKEGGYSLRVCDPGSYVFISCVRWVKINYSTTENKSLCFDSVSCNNRLITFVGRNQFLSDSHRQVGKIGSSVFTISQTIDYYDWTLPTLRGEACILVPRTMRRSCRIVVNLPR